jgi:hypothetical protein
MAIVTISVLGYHRQRGYRDRLRQLSEVLNCRSQEEKSSQAPHRARNRRRSRRRTWRRHYNTVRPHSSLRYLPPPPQTLALVQEIRQVKTDLRKQIQNYIDGDYCAQNFLLGMPVRQPQISVPSSNQCCGSPLQSVVIPDHP